MKFTRFTLIAGIGLGLSACATADLPTRNAPFEEIPATSVTTPQGYRAALPSEETVQELRDTTVLKAVIEAPQHRGRDRQPAERAKGSVPLRIPGHGRRRHRSRSAQPEGFGTQQLLPARRHRLARRPDRRPPCASSGHL
ncbi:hypothetical protein ACFOHS_08200 [Jhaorihella thermophila]